MVLSGFCCVCHVFPPLVSIFGLFPVLVKCHHYELILVQLCLSPYLWFTRVFIVLSVQFDFVWSTRYSRCFLSVSLALSWLKTIIWVYVLVCVSLFLPAVCTVTGVCWQKIFSIFSRILLIRIRLTFLHILLSVFFYLLLVSNCHGQLTSEAFIFFTFRTMVSSFQWWKLCLGGNILQL